jgi:acyl-CoA thioesterase-2
MCHSLHSYFLLPGDAQKPVVYDVECVRDGRSFSTRRIKAIQNGKSIFYMTASFQIFHPGLSHQHALFPNDVPAPDTLQPDIKRFEKNLHKMPHKMREALAYHKPVDTRSIPSDNKEGEPDTSPTRRIWLRAIEGLGDSPVLNQAALAYASDYHFLSTALKPHGVKPSDKSMALATIDHAMWFHQPVDFDDWLLYCMESPFSANARGFVKGEIYSKTGSLIASATQEGLMRKREQ